MKADSAFRLFGRGYELADGFKQSPYLSVMLFDLAFQFIQLPGEILIFCNPFPQSDERLNDKNADPNRPFAPKNAGKHGHAVFGKRQRQGGRMLQRF